MADLLNLAEVMEEEGESGVSSEDVVDSNKYKLVLGLKEVHILAMFSLIYVGVEVTMGGAYLAVFSVDRVSDSGSFRFGRLERHLHSGAAKWQLQLWLHCLRFLRR